MTLSFKSTLIASSSLLLLWTATGKAAPACQHVLQSLAAEQINATLDKLAELRMELDLEKATGPLTSPSKQLERDYRAKLRESAEALNMNSKDLQKTLQERIQRLQTLQNKNDSSERDARQTEKKDLVNPVRYTLEKQDIPFGWHSTDREMVLFFEDPDILYYFEDSHFYKFDIKKGSPIPEEFDRFVHELSRDHNVLYQYRLGMLAAKKMYQSNIPFKSVFLNKGLHSEIHSISVSASGDKLAALTTAHLLIFDNKTGNLLKEFPTVSKEKSLVKFLNEDEVLFNSQDEILTKLNLITNKETSSGLFSQGPVVIVNDRIFFKSEKEVVSVSADTLQMIQKLSVNPADTTMSEVPGHPEWIAIMGPPQDGISGIFDSKDLSRSIYNFENRYIDDEVFARNIFFTPDGETAVILHNTSENRELKIDILKREQP